MNDINIRIRALLDSSSTATIQSQINQIQNQLTPITIRTNTNNSGINSVNSAVRQLSSSTQQTQQSMRTLGTETERTGQSFFSAGKKFVTWLAMGTAIMTPIHSIQNGIKTIYELDTALTDLKKVSDELGNTIGFKEFALQANQMAIDVGHSTKSAIDAVTEFKRLGYSLGDSEILAKQALIYSNIGDVEIGDSTKTIISTLKGFNLTAEDTLRVMDALNEVGNNYAISSAGLGSALQRSSSALYEANNSLEESIGLITAGNASIQNPEKVGNGLKTVSMRLRGIADDAGEAVPELDKLIKSLTGVDIMQDENTFKSTYKIMEEISKVWKNIDDIDQATLLEKMFGKQQGAVGASILNNMADGVGAYETAINSAGSSAKEQAAYMESMEAKLNTFHETVTKFWQDSFNSDMFKGIIDGATKFIEVFDELVNNPMTKFIAIAVSGALIGKGLVTMFAKLGTSALASQIAVMRMGTSLIGFSATMEVVTGLLLASPLFWGAVAFASIYGIVKAVDYLTVSFAEQKKMVEDLTGEVQSLQSEYDALSSKNYLTAEEQKKLDILTKQLEIKKELLALEQKEANEMYVENYTKEYTTNADKYGDTSDISRNNSELDKTNATIEKYNKNLEKLESIQSKIDTESNFDKKEALQKQYDILAQKVKYAESSFSDLYQEQSNALDSGAEFTNELTDQHTALGNIVSATEENSNGNAVLASSYNLLSTSIDKVTNKKALTKEETDALITLYPDLESAVLETADGFYIESDALTNLSDSAKQSAQTQIASQIKLTESVIENAKQRMKAYTLEGEALSEKAQQNIANLKAGMPEAFRAYVSEKAGKEVNVPTDSMIVSDAESRLAKLKALSSELNALGGSSSTSDTSSSSSDSKSTPSAISHVDESQAIVDTINQQTKLDAIQNDYLESQIKIAENAKDYTKQIELQNQLLASQQKTVSDLKLANDQIHAQAEAVRASTAYNTESWFNADNTDTTSYIALLNTFEGKTDEASKNAVEKIQAIHDKLKTLKDGWISNQDAVGSLNESILSMSDTIKSLTKDALQVVSDMEDELVEMWEDEYDRKLEDLEDWYDTKKEKAQEDYDEQKQRYEDDLDEFTDYINEKKQVLNRSFDENTFNSDLAEKQKELADLQAKFNELSLSAKSGDRVAISQQVSVSKEIADKQKEIDDLVAERSKTLQEDALDDALSDYEEFISDKQRVLEDDYNKELADIKRVYDNKAAQYKEDYSKQELYSQARQLLMSGEYDKLTTLFETYSENQGSAWSSLGSTLETEYLSRLREAASLLSQLDEAGISKSSVRDALSGSSSSSSGSSKTADSNGNAPTGTKVGDIVYTAGNHAFKVVGEGNITNLIPDSQYNPASNLTSIKLYDTGGQFEDGVIARNLSGKPEWVLNPEETEAFKFGMTVLPDLFKSIVNVPRITTPIMSNQNSVVIQGSLVNIEGNIDSSSLKKIETSTKNAFNDFAKQINSGRITINKGTALI